MIITPFQIAQTLVGNKELLGKADNPLILAMIQTCNAIDGELHDEIPWCSAFINFIAKLTRLPRSHSLAARSWLEIGIPLSTPQLTVDSDIIILKRGTGNQGHVGFFAGFEGEYIIILGGNQSNSVNLQKFIDTDVIGMRRLV